METEKENVENGKENTGWFDTLLTLGVKSAKSESYLFTIEMEKFRGDKIALIKGQEQRAIAILQKVAEKEFSGLSFQIDDHMVPFQREFDVVTADQSRSSAMYFMDNSGSHWLYVCTDEVLENHARYALTELLLSDDP